jgi:hypothetical protein
MEVAIVLTVWLTFGAFLFCGVISAPPLFGRTAISLCAAEFVATLAWSAFGENCTRQFCSAMSSTARSAAGLDIPVLTGVTFALALIYWVRYARTW